MRVLLAIVLLALTRAEIIARFRAAPITKTEGLVQVYADCDAAFRREYQQSVATFAAGVCERLYAAQLVRPTRFEEPGIVVHIGDGQGPDTNVLYTVAARADGSPFARIRLPSPGYSDMEAFRKAIARGFALAVEHQEITDMEAGHRLRETDPLLRAEDRFTRLGAWMSEGILETGRSDEDYIGDLRRVNVPGQVLPGEVLVFASRLYLYPDAYNAPFLGRYHELSFRAAIPLAKQDPRIMFAAYRKIPELIALGGGRGERMDAAIAAYCAFLQALSSGKKPDDELGRMLLDAELKLKGLLP